MKRLALVSYIFLIHAALAALAWSSSIPERLGVRERPHSHVETMRLIHEYRSELTPAGASVFLGDSITERMPVCDLAPNSVNFGVSWQRTDQLLASIPEAITRSQKVYLLIGANDILQGRISGIENRIDSLGRALEGSSLIWTGIMLPGAEGANARIESVCRDLPDCTYVQPVSGPDFFSDGVHLNSAGYAEWKNRLREAAGHP